MVMTHVLIVILLASVYIISEINQVHKKISLIMQVLPKFCDNHQLIYDEINRVEKELKK